MEERPAVETVPPVPWQDKDIVERLRDPPVAVIGPTLRSLLFAECVSLISDAADEIERLRAENARLFGELEACRSIVEGQRG